MAKINLNYELLNESYLFSTIARKVNEYSKLNPDKKIIKMGIGDVTLPLAKDVIEQMHAAVDDMGRKETFHGYGPEQGYDFVRESVQKYYLKHNVNLNLNEIFIGDGAKSDLGNILDLFDVDNTVLIPDPVYPVYVDTNTMTGRTITYMQANFENGFLPMPDSSVDADIIYLCSPNNPTGSVYNAEQLRAWVNYALEKNAVILFDSAYEAFIEDPNLPHSIYQIEGAKDCAIEFCSLSKTAGFTGTRCGYTIVPEKLIRDGVSLNKMWNRRQTTKFNGVSYIIQKGAAAVFTDSGMAQCREMINYYKENARIMARTLDNLGIKYTGGINSPYVWMKCPDGFTSWEFFDYLLNNICVVGTPGSGFGVNGEGYFRLTAFGNRENTITAMKLIEGLLSK